MSRSMGIDFGQAGPHRVRCLDEQAQLCDAFTFWTTPEGLATLERRVFRDGADPVIVFEPTGLAWLPVAVYLRSRHPNCRLVRAKGQKVAVLRKYLRGRSKSDRIDALTLAKMPFIDPEQLYEVYLPPAKLYALLRLTRQRHRLGREIASRKTRLGCLIDGYLPGLRQAFSDPWSHQARAFYHSRLNPFAVVREGEEALCSFLWEASGKRKGCLAEAYLVYTACYNITTLYELSREAGVIDEEFFADFEREVATELRLLEHAEAEAEALAKRIGELYQELHPEDHLRTIPGVGEHTAPVFLSSVGKPGRFRNQSAFGSWSGVIPGARQSSGMESKGLKMTKEGPAVMKWALYQAGDVARQWDPQLACVYYRQMVYHGKTHKQAMGAVMSHLGARILAVLREGRPYELRDIQGNPITREEARQLILEQYRVPEEIRQERRRQKRSKRSRPRASAERRVPDVHRMHKAAFAPQPGVPPVTPATQSNQLVRQSQPKTHPGCARGKSLTLI